MMKNPLHDAMDKLHKSVVNGHITLDELRKTAKKYPKSMADVYLKTIAKEK